MKVSLRQAFKNVASEKYDKKNFLLFLAIMFISGVLGVFLPVEFQNQELLNKMAPAEFLALFTNPEVIIVLVISGILGLLTVGFIVVATNNAIIGKQGVFPHPIEEAGKLFTKGILYYLGCFIVLAVIMLISVIISVALVYVNPWLVLLVVPIVILMVHAWLCVNFGFYMTLEFKEWFCFRKNWMMIAKILRRFASYVAKSLVLILLCSVIVCFVIPLILGLQFFVETAAKDLQAGFVFGTVLTSIFNAVVCGFASAYSVDLTAQLLSPVVIANKEGIEE